MAPVSLAGGVLLLGVGQTDEPSCWLTDLGWWPAVTISGLCLANSMSKLEGKPNWFPVQQAETKGSRLQSCPRTRMRGDVTSHYRRKDYFITSNQNN